MARIFTFKNKRHLPAWLAWLLAGMLRLYAWTFRFRIVDPEGQLARMRSGSAAVLVLWHNRILFAAPLFPRSNRKASSVLISASRDGEYISTLIKCFGIKSVRGSSSRGGARALVELSHELKNSRSVMLTVDGPRGPRYQPHPGAAALGLKCRVPVIPVAINASHYWQLRSWDKMQIPWPFTRVELVVGSEIDISESADAAAAAEQIRTGLMSVTRDRI